MAQVLRLSVVLAAIEVAVAVSHVLVRLGQLLHAAEDVSAREILPGVTEIFLCHAEILGGGTGATMVVAVVMVVVMAVVVVVVILIEQITQETSNETTRERQQTEHSILHMSLGVPAPAPCRRLGACRQGD